MTSCKERGRIIREVCVIEENMTGKSSVKKLSLDNLSFILALVPIEDAFEIEGSLPKPRTAA